jgi:hypothetical protein
VARRQSIQSLPASLISWAIYTLSKWSLKSVQLAQNKMKASKYCNYLDYNSIASFWVRYQLLVNVVLNDLFDSLFPTPTFRLDLAAVGHGALNSRSRDSAFAASKVSKLEKHSWRAFEGGYISRIFDDSYTFAVVGGGEDGTGGETVRDGGAGGETVRDGGLRRCPKWSGCPTPLLWTLLVEYSLSPPLPLSLSPLHTPYLFL